MLHRLIVAIGMLAGTAASGLGQERALRSFTMDDLTRVRQPLMASLSPDGQWISYVLGDSLWVAPAQPRTNPGGTARAISAGMRNQIDYERPFVAWAPRGDKLLFRTGTKGPADLGTATLFDLKTQQLRPLLPDSLAGRLQTFLHWAAGGPRWSPDGKRIAFLAAQTGNAPSTHLQLYVVDAGTGRTETWANDTTAAFGGIASAAWSPGGEWLAYSSGTFRGDRGRVALLRVRDRGKSLPAVLLEGGSPMYRDLHWSADGRFLSATAHDGRKIVLRIDGRTPAEIVSDSVPLSILNGWIKAGPVVFGQVRQGMSGGLATVNALTGELSLLTGRDTLFTPVGLGRTGTTGIVAFTAESGDLPLDIWTAVLSSGEKGLRVRHRATEANAWLDSVALAEASVFRWQSRDGATLEAQLFLPPGYGERNDKARLPVVVMPYGGYRNEFPKSEYLLTAGIQLLAARGYAVVRPNTRGTATEPGWGDRYGATQLEDTEDLLDALDRAGTIDPQRVAVIGHSHGGAMAYYYLTHSRRFCGVVAVNGWSDWSEIKDRVSASEGELPAKLRRDSPLLNAASVSTPLLAVSGQKDTQVLPHNARKMVEALQQLGKPAELLHYPEEGHQIHSAANLREFWRTTFRFLDESCNVSSTQPPTAL